MSVVDTSIKQVLPAAPKRREVSLPRALADFLHDFQRTIFDTYHPERHYMRGPGPACAAKARMARLAGRSNEPSHWLDRSTFQPHGKLSLKRMI
jgi:hypothetical protein